MDEPKPIPTSAEIKQLVASDELSKAVNALSQLSKQTENNDLQNDVALIAGQFENFQREQRLGTTAPEKLFRWRTQIGRSLLEMADVLPNNSTNSTITATKGISENQIKKQIFVFILFTKLTIISYVVFQWSTGGFTKGEMLAAIGILIPVFTAYLTIMVREYVVQRHEFILKTASKRVNTTFRNLTYLVFPIYWLLLIWVIGLKPTGALNFGEMTSLLAIVESGFGVYVGEVVFGLFKKD